MWSVIGLPRAAAPCLGADRTAQQCVVALLHGAGCCANATCALCQTTRERMLSRGFDPVRVAAMMRRTRRDLLDACPVCGFPPPPPFIEIPPLPRLDRSDNPLTGSSACQICDRPLKPPQRKFCGSECWLEHRRRTEGWGAGGDRRNERGRRVARFGAE
ncbi:MAG: hypothetical protein K8T90_09135 [Planctomycetes bacterium]|nr:hypothetical protein [Planctomycetota bacterium]